MRYTSAAWLMIGFLSGCAQPSIPHTSPKPVTTQSSAASSEALTRLELDRSAASGNLMAALQKTRPWFLIARGGGTLLVSIDGSVVTDTSVLRTIPVTDVCVVRLRRGTSGAGRSMVLPNGDVSSGGDVIEVALRHDTTALCPRDDLHSAERVAALPSVWAVGDPVVTLASEDLRVSM